MWFPLLPDTDMLCSLCDCPHSQTLTCVHHMIDLTPRYCHVVFTMWLTSLSDTDMLCSPCGWSCPHSQILTCCVHHVIALTPRYWHVVFAVWLIPLSGAAHSACMQVQLSGADQLAASFACSVGCCACWPRNNSSAPWDWYVISFVLFFSWPQCLMNLMNLVIWLGSLK